MVGLEDSVERRRVLEAVGCPHSYETTQVLGKELTSELNRPRPFIVLQAGDDLLSEKERVQARDTIVQALHGSPPVHAADHSIRRHWRALG